MRSRLSDRARTNTICPISRAIVSGRTEACIEQRVPFLVSRRLRPEYLAERHDQLRNFDIFDAVLNGLA
jgi:hypothetical protein